MCIRDSGKEVQLFRRAGAADRGEKIGHRRMLAQDLLDFEPVSYTHLRAHETVLDLVCRLLLEKKKKTTPRKCGGRRPQGAE